MLIVHSHNGVPTRLTEERWQHIMQRHPDMETQRERILETLTEPDMIQEAILGHYLWPAYTPRLH